MGLEIWMIPDCPLDVLKIRMPQGTGRGRPDLPITPLTIL